MLGRHSIKCSSCPLLHMQPLLQPVSQMKVSVSSYSFPVCIQPCITRYRDAVVWGFDMVGSAGYECGPPWYPEIQESDTWGLVCWTGFLARPCLESCDFILIPQIVCMRDLLWRLIQSPCWGSCCHTGLGHGWYFIVIVMSLIVLAWHEHCYYLTSVS